MADAGTPVIDLCDEASLLIPPAAARMPEHSQLVSLLDDDDNAPPRMTTTQLPCLYAARRPRKRPRLQSPHPVAVATATTTTTTTIDNRKRGAMMTTTDQEVEVVGATLAPLDRVLEVFPDVRVQHAQSLLQQQLHMDVAQILAVLGEGSYPKQEAPTKTKTGLVHNPKMCHAFPYDYTSTCSFVPTRSYQAEAQQQLVQDFPFLSKPGAKAILGGDKARSHYAVAHEIIKETILGGPLSKNEDKQEVQFRLWKSAASGVPLTATQIANLTPSGHFQGRMVLIRPRRSRGTSFQVGDAILKDEVRYVQGKLDEWEHQMKALLQRKRARAKSVKEGTCLECMCCFDSVAFEEMIPCRQTHLFCTDCVRRFAESQIFGAGNFGINPTTKKQALELLCMSGDGCTSGFDRRYLEKVLPGKAMEKYDELAFHVSVAAAGIGDSMCTCPKCDYEAVLPETQMIFQCPVAECGFESCRKCGEESHIPMRCEEVVRDKVETKGRLQVEEAISEAKIRTCPTPKCGTKFVKSDGCNKMTCTKCSKWSCYVCRKAVPKNIGYQHFCQKFECKHERCGGCPLYTNVEEDDKRAMREAGIEVAERVREESLSVEATGDGKPTTVSEVRVDVDSLLR